MKKLLKWIWIPVLGILIFVIRLIAKQAQKHGGTTADEIRLTIGHLEAEKNQLKKEIEDEEKKRAKLKEKYGKIIRVIVFTLLCAATIDAKYLVRVDNDLIDFSNITNYCRYLEEDRSRLRIIVNKKNLMITNLEYQVRMKNRLLMIYEREISRNKTETFLLRWGLPVAATAGVFIGVKLKIK